MHVIHTRCCGLDVHVRLVPLKRACQMSGERGLKEVKIIL